MDNSKKFNELMDEIAKRVGESFDTPHVQPILAELGKFIYLAALGDEIEIDFEPKSAGSYELKWDAAQKYFDEIKVAATVFFQKYPEVKGLAVGTEWDGEDMYNKLRMVDERGIEIDGMPENYDWKDLDKVHNELDVDLFEVLSMKMSGYTFFWSDGTDGWREGL